MDIEMDSDLEDILEFDVVGTIVPYSFEPLRENGSRSPVESSDSEHETDSDDSDTNLSLSEWCSCSNCIVMPTERENKCCKSTNIVDAKAEGLRCIIDHEGFAVNCTNVHVLETSYYEYLIQNGPMQEGEVIHEVYRYIAYRRFTRWIHRILGKRNRRIIPSCAVTAIRAAFPSEEYAGFKYPQ